MGHKLCVSRHVIVLAFTKIDAVGDIFEVHDRKKMYASENCNITWKE